MKLFNTKPISTRALLLWILLTSASLCAYGEDDHADDHENAINLSAALANHLGITTAVAGTRSLEQTVSLYASVITPPEHKAELAARFNGVVTAINVAQGDKVAAGAVLAVIESNDSLRPYQLRAPIAGIVQTRAINVGELTDNKILFTIVDPDQLQLEFKVFAGQRDQLHPGQLIHFTRAQKTWRTQLQQLLPSANDQPYLLARSAPIGRDHSLHPGDIVSARITTDTQKVALAVDTRALQTVDGHSVIFIKDAAQYSLRKIRVGLSDGSFSQVIDGLGANEIYVVEGSYLLKAEFEKSAAEHDH